MARGQPPNSLAHAAKRHYKENQSFLSRGAADTGTTLFRFSPIQFDSTYRLRLSPSLGEEEVPMTITRPTWHFCVLAWATSLAPMPRQEAKKIWKKSFKRSSSVWRK